jgi:thymidine kinase
LAKLYFRYGAVGSAKTLNLLAAAYSYNQQDKKVLVIKPELDNRFGRETVKSRAGLEREADLLVTPNSVLPLEKFKNIHCILVDEAQFLSANVIEQLRVITIKLNIPVICYGLRTDFRNELFSGSKRLMELADDISEIKTTCSYCNRKGVFNLKLLDNVPTLEGPVVDLGTEEKYLPTCASCYNHRLPKSWAEQPGVF